MDVIRSVGVLMFAAVVGINAAGLGLDAALYTMRYATVSDFARSNQWCATIIIILNAMGLLGLVLHFSQAPQ